MSKEELQKSTDSLWKCVGKYWNINHSKKPKEKKHELKLILCRTMVNLTKEHVSIQYKYTTDLENRIEVLENRLKRLGGLV